VQASHLLLLLQIVSESVDFAFEPVDVHLIRVQDVSFYKWGQDSILRPQQSNKLANYMLSLHLNLSSIIGSKCCSTSSALGRSAA
jgi:hypothetical protein